MLMKVFRRSRTNKVLFGVCGGIGEYFNLDPVFIRGFAILIMICSGVIPIFWSYVILCLVIPRESKER